MPVHVTRLGTVTDLTIWEGSMRFASGTGYVVLRREGGRVSELRPREDLPNLLWEGNIGAIAGGDRMWPAPELELAPAERPDIDPGDWTDDLRTIFEDAVMSRTIEPLEDVGIDLPWAGYRVTDRLETHRGWSAWHLVMVPAPARVFVRGASDPVVYYPPAPRIVDGWIEATGTAPRWKVGFPPPLDGHVLLAAIGPDDPGPVVVVHAYADPDGTYVDVPPDGSGRATAVQVYDDDGHGFCELEHHAPLETRTYTATVLGAWGPLDARLGLLGSQR